MFNNWALAIGIQGALKASHNEYEAYLIPYPDNMYMVYVYRNTQDFSSSILNKQSVPSLEDAKQLAEKTASRLSWIDEDEDV